MGRVAIEKSIKRGKRRLKDGRRRFPLPSTCGGTAVTRCCDLSRHGDASRHAPDDRVLRQGHGLNIIAHLRGRRRQLHANDLLAGLLAAQAITAQMRSRWCKHGLLGEARAGGSMLGGVPAAACDLALCNQGQTGGDRRDAHRAADVLEIVRALQEGNALGLQLRVVERVRHREHKGRRHDSRAARLVIRGLG